MSPFAVLALFAFIQVGCAIDGMEVSKDYLLEVSDSGELYDSNSMGYRNSYGHLNWGYGPYYGRAVPEEYEPEPATCVCDENVCRGSGC